MSHAGEKKEKKVLIVEDEPSMRSALVEKFTREGFSAHDAGDGAEGFACAIRERPDLILLDLMMPKMDGFMMLKRLREEGEYGKHVPVIVLTNVSADGGSFDRMMVETEPSIYLVKTNCTVEDVVGRALEELARLDVFAVHRYGNEA